MYNNFIRNISRYVLFTEKEILYILSLIEPRQIKKNEMVFREGEVCRHVSYLNKGLLRYYHTFDNVEKTTYFFVEDMWVSDYASFLSKKPSAFAIEALEDSELFMLNYDVVQEAYDKAKVFERFGRRMAEEHCIQTIQDSFRLLTTTPEERYLNLLETNPDLINRAPLKYIASMLGVIPESLSRIRKRISAR
ncbi:MAG: Crp/Fnr family transcriptional regulator [Filimonas sp.]|nr:Crp/Fnr family transcriptional regulator [Filimonas sp.]